MTTDCAFAYLCGAITGMFATPLGWVVASPAGWAATATLCDGGPA